MQFLQLLALQPMQVLPENANLTGSRFQNSDQYIQQRTLAAPASAQNYKRLLGKHFKTDSIENSPPIWKDLCQVDNLEDRHFRIRDGPLRVCLFNYDGRFVHG